MAAKSKTEKTKAPSGLKIVRAGKRFTLTWKIGDKDYKDGQYFSYIINDTGKDKWSAAEKISVGATSRAITIDPKKFYPYNKQYLYDIGMRVKGNRTKYTTGSGKSKKEHNPGASDWTEKRFTFQYPRVPSLSVELHDTLSNVCTFTWSVTVNSDDAYMFTDTEWQTILVKESQVTDGSKLSWKSGQLGWSTGTAGSSGSRTVTENTVLLANASHTRWFRIRARGPRGVSAWRYAKHVYAMPYRAEIKSATAAVTGARGYNCKVTWAATANAAHPIDKTVVEYAIETPLAGLVCPDGASWEEISVSRDTGGNDAAAFFIDDLTDLDECLFLRVNTQHDSNINYGNPRRVVTANLTDPENIDAEVTSATDFTVEVTAENKSNVPDSFLVVLYRRASQPNKDLICGIIPHNASSTNVKVPSWTSENWVSFGVYAVQGSYSRVARADGITQYSVTQNTRSTNTIWSNVDIAKAPENVSLTLTDTGQVKASWDWTWTQADSAEISWADDELAWQSTSGPNTYSIEQKVGSWYIDNLDMGKKWYVRVRLCEGDQKGPWSIIVPIDLARTPITPTVQLSDARIRNTGNTTISWTYLTSDGTEQSYAEIAVRTVVDNVYKYTIIGHVETLKSLMIHAASVGFVAGQSYDLCVRVTSASGRQSAWSDAVTVSVATPLTAQILQSSLQYVDFPEPGEYELKVVDTQNIDDIQIDEEIFKAYTSSETGTYTFTYAEETWSLNGSSVDLSSYGMTVVITAQAETALITLSVTAPLVRQVLSLTEMPMTVTVQGAGAGGTTIVSLERASAYHLDRPDEDTFNGFEGETVLFKSQTGESQITIGVDDLIGSLDDGAAYRLVAVVQDGLGQAAQAIQSFEVHWSHQALIPSADIIIDEDNLVAKITPIAPEGADPTDVADIYRLSIDKPELIVRGAQFGVTYVDPYPTLGEMGGHRVVLRTKNGDYITTENTFALVDSPELGVNPIANEEQLSIIDFEGKQIRFYYDTDYSNTWAKDFQETQYLGGSIQGDWNPAVSRTGTLSTQAITVLDQDMLQVVRRLAEHPGICHVRTADGSSYAADVQVSEDRVHEDQEMLVNYALSITRVDSQKLDGMTLEQWEAETQEPIGGND